MFKVKTFQHPLSFYQQLSFRSGDLHITGIGELTEYVRQKLPDDQRNIVSVRIFDTLMEELFPEWHDTYTILFLTSKIRQYISLLDLGVLDIKESVKSFRMVVELGLRDVAEIDGEQEAGDREKQAFRLLVQKMLADQEVQRYTTKVNYDLFLQRLAETLGHPVERIVVHQVRRMDAKRMLFFHACQSNKLPVEFYIPQERQHRLVTSNWTRLYEMIVPDKIAWQDAEQHEATDREKHVYSLLYGGDVTSAQEGIYTTDQFPNLVSFRTFLKENRPVRDHVQYVAPSHEPLNQMFRDLWYDADPDTLYKPFVHPSEQFLYYLYECRRTETDIELTFDTFIACVTSGWVQTSRSGVNGQNAKEFLQECKPYFETIRTLGEIKERLECLERLREASQTFDDQAQPFTERNRIKQYLMNPFRVFSYVQSGRYAITIKQMLEVVDYLGKAVTSLLPKEAEQMAAIEHVKRIAELLERVRKQRETTFFSENLTRFDFAAFLPRLKELPETWQITRLECRELVASLLSPPKKRNKGDQQYIHSIEQIEGLILRTEKALHITDLSLRSMNNYMKAQKTLPRYLNYTWLKQSAKFATNEKQASDLTRSVEVDSAFHQARAALWKSLLYQVLAYYDKEISISWIQGLHEHDSPSHYWTSLHVGNVAAPPSKSEDTFDLHEEGVALGEPETRVSQEPLKKALDEIPMLYWLDFDFCARKFFITSFIQLQPLYVTDFHQQLAFATIGKLLASTAYKHQGVYEHVNPLFPQWTDTLKRNLVLTHYPTNIRELRHFQNMRYPFAMRSLQALRSVLGTRVGEKWKRKNAYTQNQSVGKEWVTDLLPYVSATDVQAETGKHCFMCAFVDSCDKGVYAVEYRDE